MTDPIGLARFAGRVPFAALPAADVPNEPGVYAVVRPSNEPPTFLDRSLAGHFKGRDPGVPVDELERLGVPGQRVGKVAGPPLETLLRFATSPASRSDHQRH